MDKIYREYEIKIMEQTATGGRIRINTASVDRDRDRVFPGGAKIENYLKNPVVNWGHNYSDPWAIIGRTHELTITPEYIDASFSLRPAANEQDPQNVVKLLWDGHWVNTASIGFLPDESKSTANEHGGRDYPEWELIEWSLVALPSNQDALRQNALKSGRVLSAKNESKIREAVKLLGAVLESLGGTDDEPEKAAAAPVSEAVPTGSNNDTHTSDALPGDDLLLSLETYLEALKEAYHV